MTRFGAAAMMVISLGAIPAYAQKPLPITGAGRSLCADYVGAYEAYQPFMGKDQGATATRAYANYIKYEEWLLGFLFGVSTDKKGYFEEYDATAMRKWIYKYCKKNQTTALAEAGMGFYLEIGGVIPGSQDHP